MKIKKLVELPKEKPDEVTVNDQIDSQFNHVPDKSIKKSYLFGGLGIFVLAILVVLYFFVFNKDKEVTPQSKTNSSDDLKLKELELKEKELKLREKELELKSKTGAVENYENDNDKEEIRYVVNNILTAWQNKDIKGFFSNLTSDYRYESIEGVKRNYDQRLDKAYEIFANNNYINITFWDMDISNNGDIAEVRYRQDYRSTLLNDVTTKKLYLRKENGIWKVYKELSGFN